MNITLSLIGLSDKQVRHMSSDVVLITDGVASKDFLQPATGLATTPIVMRENITYTRAFTRALSQFCLLIIEIISGAALPSSFRRPTCNAARMP